MPLRICDSRPHTVRTSCCHRNWPCNQRQLILILSMFVLSFIALILRRVRNSVVQRWPEHLMAIHIIASGELCIRDPHWKRVVLAPIFEFQIHLQVLAELVCGGINDPNPKLTPHSPSYGVHRIRQSCIGMRRSLNLPWCVVRRIEDADTRSGTDNGRASPHARRA